MESWTRRRLTQSHYNLLPGLLTECVDNFYLWCCNKWSRFIYRLSFTRLVIMIQCECPPTIVDSFQNEMSFGRIACCDLCPCGVVNECGYSIQLVYHAHTNSFSRWLHWIIARGARQFERGTVISSISDKYTRDSTWTKRALQADCRVLERIIHG